MSEKKCACLSEMKCYGSNKCCFYKTKQQQNETKAGL